MCNTPSQSPQTLDNRQLPERQIYVNWNGDLSELDQWQISFLRKAAERHLAAETLFSALDTLAEFAETTNPTEAISELFGDWVMSASIGSKQREHMRTIVDHLAMLTKFRTAYECLNVMFDFANQPVGKEVGHE